MTLDRDRQIDIEIAASVRLALSGRPIGSLPRRRIFGVAQPRAAALMPAEPSYDVCLYVLPTYHQRRSPNG